MASRGKSKLHISPGPGEPKDRAKKPTPKVETAEQRKKRLRSIRKEHPELR